MRGGKSYDYHNFCYVSFHVEKMKHHRLRRSFPLKYRLSFLAFPLGWKSSSL